MNIRSASKQVAVQGAGLQVARVMRTVAALAFTLTLGIAGAQEYPSRTVTVVVPFQAGGVVDVATRLVVDSVSTRTGKTIIVENRTGAEGLIGLQAVLRAKPDGYTLVSIGQFIVTTPMLRKDAGFKTSDLTPVAVIGGGPNVIITSPTLPVKNLKEFVEYARARPGKLNAATGSRGGSVHLGAEVFMQTTGIDMQLVPYKGAGEIVQSISSGQLNFALVAASVAAPVIKAGMVKPLAVASPARVATLPDVPTVVEAGLPAESVVFPWYAIAAKAGTPAATIEWWNAQVNEALKSPKVVERLRGLSVVPTSRSVLEFAAMLREEETRWSKLFKEKNIQPE